MASLLGIMGLGVTTSCYSDDNNSSTTGTTSGTTTDTAAPFLPRYNWIAAGIAPRALLVNLIQM